MVGHNIIILSFLFAPHGDFEPLHDTYAMFAIKKRSEWKMQ